jgi:hypothetical protein
MGLTVKVTEVTIQTITTVTRARDGVYLQTVTSVTLATDPPVAAPRNHRKRKRKPSTDDELPWWVRD